MSFVATVELETSVSALEEVNASSFSKNSFNEIELLLIVHSLAHEHNDLNAKPYLAGPAGRRTIVRNNYVQRQWIPEAVSPLEGAP